MKNREKSSKPAQDSSPVHNPHSVEENRNQTTMSESNRFPWATIIIVALLIVICGAILFVM